MQAITNRFPSIARGWLLFFSVWFCVVKPLFFLAFVVVPFIDEPNNHYFSNTSNWIITVLIVFGVFVGYKLYKVSLNSVRIAKAYLVTDFTIKTYWFITDIFRHGLIKELKSLSLMSPVFAAVVFIYLCKSKQVQQVLRTNNADVAMVEANSILDNNISTRNITKPGKGKVIKASVALGGMCLVSFLLISSCSSKPSNKVVKELAAHYMTDMPFGVGGNNEIKILNSYSKDGAIVYVIQCGTLICDMPVIKTDSGWTARGIHCGG